MRIFQWENRTKKLRLCEKSNDFAVKRGLIIRSNLFETALKVQVPGVVVGGGGGGVPGVVVGGGGGPVPAASRQNPCW
jgi:hypothetical protein